MQVVTWESQSPWESKGEHRRRTRVRLSSFTLTLSFPSPEEAERAADYLNRFAIHKRYRGRDKILYRRGSKDVTLVYVPEAYLNEYPKSFINDVLRRIYYALEKMYELEG